MKKQLLVLLSLAVLFPSGVSFAHVFSDHEHKVCPDHGDGHFHEQQLDCEYFQFRQYQNFLSESQSFAFLVIPEISEIQFFHYFFRPQEKPSSYFLRGPPAC